MLSSFSMFFKSAQKRFLDAYYIEPKKYQKKAFGKYIGYLLLISYFILLPSLFQTILPFLLQHVPHKLITGLGAFFINLLIISAYNIVMIFIYKSKLPFFQKYRVNNKPWPWEQNYDKWINTLKKTLKVVAFNGIILSGSLGLYDSWTSDYKWSIEEIPQTKTIVWQFFFFLLFEDFFFYIGHLTLHRPELYWIHKKHHEYATTVSIAAEYAHPIEHIFGNSFPTFIGYKILSEFYPVHAIAIWVFLTFRIIETCDGHSGYEWSWAQSDLLPFTAGSSYHNFHHSHNSGNYGSFLKIWDSLFGTNSDYIKYKLKNQSSIQQVSRNPNPESKNVQQKKVY